MVTHVQLLLHLQIWPSAIVCVCVCVSLSLSGAQVICLVGCYQSFRSFLSWLSVQGFWCTGISISRFWWKSKQKFWAWNWRRETEKSRQQELVFLVVQVLLPREIVLLLEERRSSADHERVSRISSDSHRLFPDNSVLILQLQVGVLLMDMHSRLLPLVWREKKCARSEQESKHWQRNSESSDCGTGRRDDDEEARGLSLWGERGERDVLIFLRWCEPGGAERDTQGIRSVPSLRLPCRSCRVR
jgi:hypothetical protein